MVMARVMEMAVLAEKERQSKLKKIRNIETDLRLVQLRDLYKTDPYPTKWRKFGLHVTQEKLIGRLKADFPTLKRESPSLLGRNWLSAIKLDWQQIFKVEVIIYFKVFSVVSVQFLRRTLALYKG